MGYYYIPYYLYSAFEWLLLVRALYSIYFIIISISSSNSSIIVIITFLSIKSRLATPIICYLFTRNMRKTTNDLTHLSNTEISKVIATKLNNFTRWRKYFTNPNIFGNCCVISMVTHSLLISLGLVNLIGSLMTVSRLNVLSICMHSLTGSATHIHMHLFRYSLTHSLTHSLTN